MGAMMSLLRVWVLGFSAFVAAVAALCIAFSIAIAGPPTDDEMAGIAAMAGAGLHELGQAAGGAGKAACERLPADVADLLLCPAQSDAAEGAPQPSQTPADATPVQLAQTEPVDDMPELLGGRHAQAPAVQPVTETLPAAAPDTTPGATPSAVPRTTPGAVPRASAGAGPSPPRSVRSAAPRRAASAHRGDRRANQRAERRGDRRADQGARAARRGDPRVVAQRRPAPARARAAPPAPIIASTGAALERLPDSFDDVPSLDMPAAYEAELRAPPPAEAEAAPSQNEAPAREADPDEDVGGDKTEGYSQSEYVPPPEYYWAPRRWRRWR